MNFIACDCCLTHEIKISNKNQLVWTHQHSISPFLEIKFYSYYHCLSYRSTFLRLHLTYSETIIITTKLMASLEKEEKKNSAEKITMTWLLYSCTIQLIYIIVKYLVLKMNLTIYHLSFHLILLLSNQPKMVSSWFYSLYELRNNFQKLKVHEYTSSLFVT